MRTRSIPSRLRRLVPRRTIRLRLTLLYGTLFLVSGVALLGITYFLVNRATGGQPFLAAGNGRVVFGNTDGQSLRIASFHARNNSDFSRAVIVHSAGSSGSGQIAARVPVPGVAPGKAPTPQQAAAQFHLLQTQASTQHANEMHQLLLQSGLALAIVALLSVLLGWIVAGRALRPLKVITAKAQDISSTNLHARIGLTGPDDELKDLGDTFDALLDRLERSFQAQRQFVANASHELRTPLARQRTLIEVGLNDPNTDEVALRQLSERVLAAGEEQEKLIEALLTLASSERGLEGRQPVDVGAIAEVVVDEKQQEATERRIQIDGTLQPAPTVGSSHLVARLVSNLVENAIVHNLEGGWVALSTGTRHSRAVLYIANSGPTAAPAELERLFRPFERLAQERTSGAGHGLGLSIVAAIAAAHDATIEARARPAGGMEIEVRFPVATAGSARREADNGTQEDPGPLRGAVTDT